MEKRPGYDVILVVPPFRTMGGPALGASIVASACEFDGVQTKVFYADLALAEIIGCPTCVDLSARSRLSQSVFRWFALKGEREPRDPGMFFERLFQVYAEKIGFRYPRMTESSSHFSSEDLLSCLEKIPAYLDLVCDRILAWSPKIVGFSCLFSQILAAMAIAARIKQLSPNLLLVLGGPCTVTPMGQAIQTLAPCFDFVFSGESEIEFPRFVAQFINDGTLPSDKFIECSQLDDLDACPIPNYDDYFNQIRQTFSHSQVENLLTEWLPIETSKGCYRTEKQPCAFCGLNADTQGYRYKSPRRAIEEVRRLADKYDVASFIATDNILPARYFREVFPVLARSGPRNLKLFYEVQSGLSPRQLDLCVKAGLVSIQPGIETLSSSILKLIRKGVTAGQNLCLLRDCHSRQISVLWNFMLGIPGDRKEDYEAMIRLIPKIEHFQPPTIWRTLIIDRFGSYFKSPHEYGITNIRPLPEHKLIFFEHDLFDQITNQFTGDYESAFLQDGALAESMLEELNRWTALWNEADSQPMLRFFNVDGATKAIQDTRTCATEAVCLPSSSEMELLKLCERPQKRGEIPSMLSDSLSNLVERHYILDYEDMLITLATDPAIGSRLRRSVSSGSQR